jgi:3-hydroxyisobutyrate dehydrogenase
VKEAVGVVGLGSIGASVARALVRNGYSPVGYDVRTDALQALDGVVSPAASAEDLSHRVDAALIAVYDDAQVRDLLSGPSSLLTADDPARVLVILSTVSLETIRWAAEQGRSRGVRVLDCGVTGGQGLREQGKIVAMVGGDEEAVTAVMPLLATFGAPVVHTGGLGTGMRSKLARNMITYGCWYVVLEATRLAAAGGVDPGQFLQINDAADQLMGGSLALLRRGVRPGTPGSESEREAVARTAGYLHKDLHAAVELAAELGVEVLAAVLVEREFDALVGLAGGAV